MNNSNYTNYTNYTLEPTFLPTSNANPNGSDSSNSDIDGYIVLGAFGALVLGAFALSACYFGGVYGYCRHLMDKEDLINTNQLTNNVDVTIWSE